jgi:hypothetical protein
MAVTPKLGISCPRHPDARLHVTYTRKIDIGVVLRYRACSVKGCKFRVPTEERVRPKGGCRNKNHSHST